RTRWATGGVLSRNGADGNGSNLRAAAGDGAGTVWIAGASGALAEIDAESGDLISHRAPDDVTNEFTAVAIAGSDGGATVYVADSSGHVHVSAGSEGGHRTWTHATPGSGAAIRGVAVGDGRVVAVDANASVFEASDGGATWNRIGVDDADGGFRDVAVAGGTVHVAGGKLWSDAGDGWGVVDPFDTTLYDLEIGPCGCVHAVGADGTVRHRPGQGISGGATLAKWLGRWEAAHPTSEALYGIVLGRPHVAVGANGTIVER
ncbi:WD40/YVTN/BNR-like repeat-containing protein, partial [Halarchaeum acidiphilum]|uniref:WD40/YVTN/BNR-like repeat-containing protein n=1 Tax=Halarchaeum acidiphilum TaxID=489138 RepID=UPI000379C8A0